jgi:hypothetical protein
VAGVEPFSYPTDERWNENIAPLGLTPAQEHELRIQLQGIHWELGIFFEKRIDRKQRRDLVERLRAFRDAIASLRALIVQDPDALSKALPAESLEAIGLTVSPPPVGFAVAYQTPDLAGRRFLGLMDGPALLGAALAFIEAPIDDWLEQDRPDPGGREPNFVRRHVIQTLAAHAEAVIGQSATATANGAFVKLCAAVMYACGLEAEGVEEAVERELRGLRKQKPNV